MGAAEGLDVQVAYALPERQVVVPVRVEAGTRAVDAIRQSGILAQFPQIDLSRAKLGIYGSRVSGDHVVSAGDRIEIYRALVADPKTARRQRAGQAKKA